VIHYTTYFDHNYLPRALVLLESLRQHSPPFTLWCLALSDQCRDALRALDDPEVRVIDLTALETADPELAATKSSRTRAEYYFTLTSCWCEYLLAAQPDIELLTYLDSDLFFYSSPQPLFSELTDASIGIIEHRSGRSRAIEDKYGRFNVGWLSFRNDHIGRACLERWRKLCLHWCFDRVESGRFADQKYLDDWPALYDRVRILDHPGANLAPWNVSQHRLECMADEILVDGLPLIFYHFQRLRELPDGLIDLGLAHYGVPVSTRLWLRQHIYHDYVRQLTMKARVLKPLVFLSGIARTERSDNLPRWAKALRFVWAITTGSQKAWQSLYIRWSLWTGSVCKADVCDSDS